MEQNFLNAADHNPAAFFRLINNPITFKIFLLKKLPAAFFAGLRVQQCNTETCSVGVPYNWYTQNPFRSTYFACLSMAAEMSTGALVMAHLYKRVPTASMLITAMEARYHQKAKSKIVFECKEGQKIRQAIDEAYNHVSGQAITVHSIGWNASHEKVAEFWFTWSFKTKQ